MQEYTLGFLQRDDGHWLGVLKTKGPPVNVGKWNGIGGKIEPDETPGQAMAREGLEEIGAHFSWRYCGTFGTVWPLDTAWNTHAYRAVYVDEPINPTNDIGERLEWKPPIFCREIMAYNLGWLLPLVQADHVTSFRVNE